uniref:IS110 family transposase n=1 Tax=Dictyoglomus thermophilum TaxID=14 RepID=A0A7C3RV22_DICTH
MEEEKDFSSFLIHFFFITEKYIPCVIINPSIIDRFSKVKLRPSKSHKKDTKIISESLFIYKPSPSSSNKISELKKKISYIKDDIKKGNKPSFSSDMIFDFASKSIGINSKTFENILRSKIEILLLLLEELDKFDKLLSESIKDIEINDINIITSIPGIGKTSAISFLCEVQDIRRFRRAKSLIAYAGIEPVIKESGRRDVRLGIYKKGNRHLRRILFLMAMNVIKYEGKFKEFFLKLRARGKSSKSALIAVANKLLRTIYSMLIHGSFYSPNYS